MCQSNAILFHWASSCMKLVSLLGATIILWFSFENFVCKLFSACALFSSQKCRIQLVLIGSFSFLETQISSYHFFNFALPLFLSFLPIALLDWWSRVRKREIVSLVFGLTLVLKGEPGTCLRARVRRGEALLRLQGNVPLDPRQARGLP